MKIKLFPILLALAVAISCLFSACSSPMSGAQQGDEGSFSITINSGSSRAALSWDPATDISELDHTITVSGGPGAEQKQEGVREGQTVNFTVAPGRWTVTVKAYKNGALKAEGSASVDLKPGNNGIIQIKMGRPDDGSPGGNIPGGTVSITLPTVHTGTDAGKIYINTVLTADISALTNPGGGVLSYEWKKDGTTIPSATGSTYTVAFADSSATSFTVEVTSSTGGTVTSGSIGPVTNQIGIYTVAQLAFVGSTGGSGDWSTTKNYILMDNLDFSSLATSWMPLCTGSAPLSGTFDGNGRTINLGYNKVTTVAQSTYYYAGLFACISGSAIVKNLKLEGSIDVSAPSGSDYIMAGAVVGRANGGSIFNVYSNVNVTVGTGIGYAGGIAGSSLSSIKDCRSDGTITATGSSGLVGGIAGQLSSTASFCWAAGAITSVTTTGSDTGGIIGIVRTGATLTNCVALNPSITGGNPCGRVAGSFQTPPATVDNFGLDIMGGSGWSTPSFEDGEQASSTPGGFNEKSWWETPLGLYYQGPGWTIQSSKAAASETNPWYWDTGSNRPKLWFE